MLAPLLALTIAAPDAYGGRFLVIERTETTPGPGLVDTTPYARLRPGLFVKIAGAFATEDEAKARCAALKAEKGACYVKAAGQVAGTRAAVEAALEALRNEDILYRRDLEIRGRRVPLLLVGVGPRTAADVKACEGEVPQIAEARLYWSARPIVLGKVEARGRTCCARPEVQSSPAGVSVIRQQCKSASCGGACYDDTWALVVPHNDLEAGRAPYLRCTEDLAVPPSPGSTCDRLTSTKKTLRFTETGKVKATACPDAPDAFERIEATVKTTRYRKGRLQTRTKTAPVMPGLWGCDG